MQAKALAIYMRYSSLGNWEKIHRESNMKITILVENLIYPETQSVIQGQAASAPPRSLSEMQTSTSDLLHQNLHFNKSQVIFAYEH